MEAEKEGWMWNAVEQSLINKEQIIVLSRGHHYSLHYTEPQLASSEDSLALKMSRRDGRRVRDACGQSSLKDPGRRRNSQIILMFNGSLPLGSFSVFLTDTS